MRPASIRGIGILGNLAAALAMNACVAPNEGVTNAAIALPATEASPKATPSPRPSATPSPRPSATPSPRPSATPSPRPSATPPVSSACLPSTIAGKGTTTARPAGSTTSGYGFYEYLPPDYSAAANAKRAWPLIVMLHGSGERGNGTTQLARVLKHGPNKRIAAGREFPAIVLTPQTPVGWGIAALDKLLDYAEATYRIDPKRIYLTGLSLGGGGAWNYTRAHADRLAAVIPICGAADANDSSAERLALNSLPVYSVQNLNDPAVRYTRTLGFANSIGAAVDAKNEALDGYLDNGKAVDTTATLDRATKTWKFDLKPRALRDASGRLRAEARTIFAFPQTGGHDAWTRTYADEDTWNWLFCQHR